MWLLFVFISLFTLSLRATISDKQHRGVAWFAWFASMGATIYALVLHHFNPIISFILFVISILVGCFAPEIVFLIRVLYRKLVRINLAATAVGALYLANRVDSELIAIVATFYLLLINIVFYLKDRGEGLI